MAEINILPVEVSNKIAAGEVVERPASVIKELVENSIDAGSSRVVVEIKNGGATYVSVTDNGKGMSKDDALRAFLRHATSKIKTEEDLDAIYTLGFRGEALSSIGAVSKAELITKRREDSEGICVTCEGGEIIASEDSGMADGTRFVIRDLFYNTPARMKFLKKDATEAGYITDVMTKFVLSHPEISFKYIKSGKEAIFSNGDGNLHNAVYAVYGRDYATALIDVDYEYQGIKVTGVIGKGRLARPNRSFQSFFVNNRTIKSPMITRAVEEAYKNQIMIGKFPVAVLNLEINPALIDINVHPTKLEVKFSDEKAVYEAVYYGVKSALYAIPDVPAIEKEEKKKPETVVNPFVSEQKKENIKENQISVSDIPVREEKKEIPAVKKETHMPKPEKVDMPLNLMEMFIKKDTQTELKMAEPEPQYVKEIRGDAPCVDEKPQPAPEKQPEPEETKTPEFKEIKPDFSDYRIAGQVFDTYIIAEHGDEVIFIDQHAAHERIKYEQLIRSVEEHEMYPQMLLEPAIVRLGGAEESVFEENADFFAEIGFEAEPFGGGQVIIRTSPPDVDAGDTEDLFVELLSELIKSKKEVISAKKQRLLYTIACKAAVKANHRLNTQEMENLLKGVLSLENINTCPHGRPIMISMTKKELEKQFKRIV